jgi:hypothetical protein
MEYIFRFSEINPPGIDRLGGRDHRSRMRQSVTFCVGYGLSFGCRSAAGTCGSLASPSCSPRNDAASP